ncbi:MAG: LysR family transcriptional regulator [Pseudodonghicola sp.]
MLRSADLRQLRYFSVVAETLSFSEAAQRLHVAQPAISRAVRDLEQSLGVTLFVRTTRKVTLTPEGAALAKGADRAWQTLETTLRMVQQIRSGVNGEILLGYSAQSAHGPMSKLLIKFRQHRPGIKLKLQLRSSEEQIDQLRQGRMDMGFLLSAAVPPDLEEVQVTREKFVALLPEAHPLAQEPEIHLRMLRDEPFILGTAERWRMFRTLIEGACLHEGFRPRVVGEGDDTPLLLEMIASGLGVSLYGAPIVHVLPPGVRALPVAPETPDFGISMCWNGQAVTPAMAALVSFIRDELARQQAAAG